MAEEASQSGEIVDGLDPDENTGGISQPFDPEKIKVKTEPRTLDLVMKRIDRNEIDLEPEFQRRARVWPISKKSQLIESLLLKIPLPVFYVSAAPNDDWSVVDGLQRLTTISDFVRDEFALTGLEYLEHLDQQKFSELPRPLQRRIEETVIVVHIIEPGTPDDVMINIFKRLNTGGEPLTQQEIRNALVKGPVRQFLRDLATGLPFLAATEGTVKDTRMDAQECVARFCAFYLRSYTDYGDSDLDTFILRAMKKISSMSDDERIQLAMVFENAMRNAIVLFGRYAFRKFFGVDTRRGPISKALFEATAVNLALLSDKAIKRLIDRKEKVVAAMAELMASDSDFLAAITSTTGTRRRVSKRFNAIEILFARLGND